MKKYINKSNQKIVLYAWGIFASFFIAIIASVYNMINASQFSVISIFNVAIIQLILLLVIISNSKERYTFYEDGMLVKRISSKEVYWEKLSEVFISDWYIKIVDKKYNTLKILKKVSQEAVFENIKKEIMSNDGPFKIVKVSSEDSENGKTEGGLRVLFIYIASSVLFGIVGFFSTVVNLFSNFQVDVSFFINIAIIIVSVFVAVLSIKVLLNIGKRKADIIPEIKKYLKFQLAFLSLMNLGRFFTNYTASSLPIIIQLINLLDSLTYGILLIAITFEYLNTSERVKHYFVK